MFLSAKYGTDSQPGENVIAIREEDVLCVPELRIIVDKLGWNYILYLALFCDPIGPFSKLPPEARDQRIATSIREHPYKADRINTVGFYMEKRYFVAAEQAYRDLVWNEHFEAFSNVRETIRNISVRAKEANDLASRINNKDDEAAIQESDQAMFIAIEMNTKLKEQMLVRDTLENIIFKNIRDRKGDTIRTGLGNMLGSLRQKSDGN